MISPQAAVIGKIVLKGAMIFVAAEAVAYEITPEKFIGLATLAVSAVTAVGILLTAILGFMNRNKLNEIHISMNGKLEQLVAAKGQVSKAEGVMIGRDQVTSEVAAASIASAGAVRDKKIVTGMVERIGEAADKAAQMTPGEGLKPKAVHET
jgi:predicted DNA-binding protein with PD1-like motif